MSISDLPESFGEKFNPLDNVEEVLHSNDWAFRRMNDDELLVDVSGRYGTYKLYFVWQEEFQSVLFSCQFEDIRVPEPRLPLAWSALAKMNAGVWLGHFEVAEETGLPFFRHTMLFRGLSNGYGSDYLNDIVEIALAECERHYPAFALLSEPEAPARDVLNLAILDVAGES